MFVGDKKNLASTRFIPQTKIYLKQITDLTVNAQTIKFKGESGGEKLHNLLLGNDLRDRTQKGKTMTNYIC